MVRPDSLLAHLASDLDLAVAGIDDPVVRGRVVLVANSLRRLSEQGEYLPGPPTITRTWPEVDIDSLP